MIIYNITVKIHPHIQEQWIVWLKEVHIPEILRTGCFTNARILLLLEMDDSDGLTYALQFHAESKALYNQYIEKFAGIINKKSVEKWGGRYVDFRTVMQVVN
ncbi:MAG: DUF4286 family protein [Ferruginibacter sp.]